MGKLCYSILNNNLLMDQLDFKSFDKRFENKPEPINDSQGQSDIDVKRVEGLKENIGNYQVPQLTMPELPGLRVHRGGALPVTRNWYRRISSYEMNGLLNVWTPTMNTKVTYWAFYPL